MSKLFNYQSNKTLKVTTG